MKYARALILASAVTVAASAANAGERQDFIVNSDGSKVEQNTPRIAVAGDGTFMVAWMDTRYNVNDIFVQKFDSSGQPVGGNQRVNDNQSVTYHFNPAIAIDVSGKFAVVWKDFRNGVYPFDPDIFFQSYTAAGAKSGSNIELTTEFPDSTKADPDISMAAWGNGVVVWADYRNQNWDIYGQLIGADGSLVGGNFRINDDYTNAQQHAPRVSTSPEGWFIVTWYDNRDGNDDIFVQRFDLNGGKLGGNFRVHSPQSSRQAFPDIATDGAGHFTVVWVDWRNGSYPANPDIYARKFDTLYAPVTPETRINTDATTRAQRQVAISSDHAGNVAIIWADSTASSSWDIVGQMIDVSGVVREKNFRANSLADSMQFDPDVALDGVYRYITWVDRRNGNFDIYASITKYNDAHLNVTPGALQFTVAAGDPSAITEQTVTVGHAGYNPLSFVATPSDSWLSATPVSGKTMADVTVSVNTSGLQPGTYVGHVTFADASRPDSGVVVPVRLDYTSPQLAVMPDSITLSTSTADLSTHDFTIQIANLGYGTLSWQLSKSADWISLATDSGQGNASVKVTVIPFFADTGRSVSPIVVDAGPIAGSPDTVWAVINKSLALPVLKLSPDSVNFTGYALSDTTFATTVTITNTGAVDFDWTAVSDQAWLAMSSDSGNAGDVVQVSASAQGRSSGSYVGNIAFSSVGGDPTLDTLVVVLNLIDGQPIVSVYPSVMRIRTENPTAIDTVITIANSGNGVLNWRAISEAPWLAVNPDSGMNVAQVRLTCPSFNLPFERHTGTIAFFDPRFPADTTRLTVELNAVETSSDSVLIESLTASAGEPDYCAVNLSVLQPVDALTVAMEYDPSMITIDSFVFDVTIPTSKSPSFTVIPGQGLAVIVAGSIGAQQSLGDGSFPLGRMYFTAGLSAGQTHISPTILDTLESELYTSSGQRLIPHVTMGDIQLEVTTAVNEGPAPVLPREFILTQNYPNPFNLNTTIEFYLPTAATINLTIFNVLGQRVRTVAAGPYASGEHRSEWDGRHENGHVCPSGVYFYRLDNGSQSAVQRMILSK